MQTERGNFRYRGWRESRPLIDFSHAHPADLKRTTSADLTNQAAYTAQIAPQLLTLMEDRISRLQHFRVQIKYRLQRDF